jgi:hypothetical protein
MTTCSFGAEALQLFVALLWDCIMCRNERDSSRHYHPFLQPTLVPHGFRLPFPILHVHFHRHRRQLQHDPIARFASGDAPRHPSQWTAGNAHPAPPPQLWEQPYVLPRLAGSLDTTQFFRQPRLIHHVDPLRQVSRRRRPVPHRAHGGCPQCSRRSSPPGC